MESRYLSQWVSRQRMSPRPTWFTKRKPKESRNSQWQGDALRNRRCEGTQAVACVPLRCNQTALDCRQSPFTTYLLAPLRQMTSSLFRRSISASRSEEHTSELQSPDHLVCRLLL